MLATIVSEISNAAQHIQHRHFFNKYEAVLKEVYKAAVAGRSEACFRDYTGDALTFFTNLGFATSIEKRKWTHFDRHPDADDSESFENTFVVKW